MENSAIFLAVPISDSASIVTAALATTVSQPPQALLSSRHAETRMLALRPQLLFRNYSRLSALPIIRKIIPE